MHTSNLSEGVLEPRVVSINSISSQFSLGFFEPLGLLDELNLHTTQLHFSIDGLFFQPRHLGFGCLSNLFQLKDPDSQGQDSCLQLDNLLALVMKLFREILFRTAEASQLLLQCGLAGSKRTSQQGRFFLSFGLYEHHPRFRPSYEGIGLSKKSPKVVAQPFPRSDLIRVHHHL